MIGLEKALLDPSTRASAQDLEELLDPQFEEIGASGRVWARAEMIEALLRERDEEPIVAVGFVGREIATDVVLVTYETVHAGVRARRSSLWRSSNGAWRLVFHQGTVAH
ncbi:MULTISPECIES: DUF4440 domain-containing protein [Nocardiaceae]|uniref:DUF4440 domain-containing protein n=1 Tax=Rhodococcoides corynebacterioides TaxID=53972 RepID=A0ABS2KV32_9NOCA|nr:MULTISPECIES: DUF4440 domain-containing protein [Rhodococcus]MBM7415804.1 hypothetical protein [Rhodococcus corynebacterioides]MBP1118266.1 hypothetical protein [Rhodococcus sp. PvP016]